MKTVIIGAGPAGISAAETLRELDKEMDITIFSSEPFPPYAPPAMLEYFLTGREVHFWKGKNIAEKLRLEYLSGTRVEKVLPGQNQLQLSNTKTMDYDYLLIATGSSLYAPVPGADGPGVYNFKSLSAAEDLIGQVREGGAHSALIVGAGFIGVEIALLLRDLGLQVGLLEMGEWVMPNLLDKETGQLVLEHLQQRGIAVHLQQRAQNITAEKHSRVVQVEGGQTYAADLLVAATGIKPNTACMHGSGIDADRGLIVDEYLCTSSKSIFAAGDVALTRNRISGAHNVHANFPNAVVQGRVAAQNMLGQHVAYEGAESINSLKHLGVPVIAGGIMEGDELKQRQGSNLRKLYLLNDRIVGYRLAGDLKSAGIYRTLMNKQTDTRPFRHRLLESNFGMGYLQDLAISH